METCRNEPSVLECFRFLGRPGPRRAGLRELSSRLQVITILNTEQKGRNSPAPVFAGGFLGCGHQSNLEDRGGLWPRGPFGLQMLQ